MTMTTQSDRDIAALLLDRLGKVNSKIHDLDVDRDDMIRAAKAAGATWTEIGESMGVSKQAAWERYRHLMPPRQVAEE